MKRNVVLALSSLAVLVILFVAYTVLVGTPEARRESQPLAGQLPPQAGQTTQPLQVGQDVSLPAGGRITIRIYDERTGRPTDLFSCRDWQPVPGSKTEVRVTEPELAMRLPSGMIATILGDEGQLSGDRIERSQMRPKQGWLAGHVRIMIDRETGENRSPRAERPQDLITINVDRVEFDLERGQLRTEDRLQVESEDFEISGVGLDMVWDQAGNRVETLSIKQGEEFVFYTPAGLFGAVGAERDANQPSPETAPASQPSEPPHKARRSDSRRTTAYTCTLAGNVVAEQFQDDKVIGGLQADEVKLLFDVGAGVGRLLRPASATQPTTRSARERGNRLVLHWNGSLELQPAPPATDPEDRRLHFVAVGSPVVMTRGDGAVRCGSVEYHDETQRIWLSPVTDEAVDFTLGKNLSATAAGVYVDRAARIVKLVGAVELRSRRGTGAGERLSTVRCTHWGELHLARSADTDRPVTEAATDLDRLESATFVGDVRVDLGQQKLDSQRLEIAFRSDSADQSLEESLDTATASGQVHMTGGDGTLDCERLELAFGLTLGRELFPRLMNASGAVQLARGKARVRGNQVTAALAPPPEGKQPGAPEFVVQTLDVVGEADLVDPDNKVAARGDHIAAVFEGLNRLATASVSGTAGERGMIYARPYFVRGERIDLDREAQTLHADGSSRLSFKTRRSLQGQERKDPTPVVVESGRLLHIDGRKNTVRFEGDVAATSGEESLRGDTLTLLLEEVPEPERPAGQPTWRDLWRQVRGSTAKRPTQGNRDDALGLNLGDQEERTRKEPVRLVADNALVSSESYERGSDVPLVHASISAPLLEVDIVRRQILTTGLTQLLMTDRRGVEDAESARAALGIPSALISRGPSQTAMQCEGRMTYTLGPEGAGRRDTVVFEDAVLFVHRAGKEMVNLEETLPQAVSNPKLLETLKSRNATLDCDRLECWFTVDQESKQPQRGGALTRSPMRLASMLASGNVYLRDQEGPRIREVNAARVEFNREESRIDVRGTKAAEARIYFQDSESGQFDAHTGEQLAINLQDGTIRTGEMTGQMHRP